VRATHLLATPALALVFVAGGVAAPRSQPEQPAATKLQSLKREALADVNSRQEFTQQMVDMIFSVGKAIR